MFSDTDVTGVQGFIGDCFKFSFSLKKNIVAVIKYFTACCFQLETTLPWQNSRTMLEVSHVMSCAYSSKAIHHAGHDTTACCEVKKCAVTCCLHGRLKLLSSSSETVKSAIQTVNGRFNLKVVPQCCFQHISRADFLLWRQLVSIYSLCRTFHSFTTSQKVASKCLLTCQQGPYKLLVTTAICWW